MTDLHDILERALEKDRTMRIQKEPESMEFDTEGIAEPAEVIVDLGIESDEGDVDEDIDNGNGGTVGFDQSHYAEMLTLHKDSDADEAQSGDGQAEGENIIVSIHFTISSSCVSVTNTLFPQSSEDEPEDRVKRPKIAKNL